MAKSIDAKRMSPEAVEARRKLARFPRYDVYMLPAYMELLENTKTRMESIQKFECHQNDIFLCTYPKSGSHWTYECLTMLLRAKAQYSSESLPVQLLESDHISTTASRRIILLHIPYRHLPEQLISKNIKIAHIVRNPKDVYVSWYCHLRGMAYFKNPVLEGCPCTWNNFIGKTMSGEYNFYDGWCNYEKEFEQAAKENENIFTTYYEEMKRDSVFELERLATFLEIPFTKQLLIDIADLTEFSKHKSAIAKLDRDKTVVQINGRNIFFRKGEVGDWKNWFTVSQNELIDNMLEKEMQNSRIKMMFD